MLLSKAKSHMYLLRPKHAVSNLFYPSGSVTLDESFVLAVPNGLLTSRKACEMLNMASKKANQGHWKGCIEPRFHLTQGHHSSTVPHLLWQDSRSANYLLVCLSIIYSKASFSPGIKATPCHWVGQTKPGHPLNPWEVYISPLNQKTRKNAQILSTCWCCKPTATATGKQNLKWNKQAAGTAAMHL